MSYPWTVYKSWVTGEVLTASDLNNSFSTAANGADPSSTNDYSATTAQMRVTTDPYPASTESLATTLSGELERIRFTLLGLTGKTYWYQPPDATIANLMSGTTVFAGAKSFSSAVTITATTNQLVLSGPTRTVTLTAPQPATSSRVITFPDLVGDYSVVGTIGTQTIAGSKTFSSAVAITATSNHLVLSTSSNTLTISAATQATTGRTWTIPDISGAGTFAALEGTQTFSGAKTFSAVVTVSGGIKGTTTNDNATALNVGEYISATATGVNAPSSTHYGDACNITLTAGDWDVSLVGNWDQNGATWTRADSGISSTTGDASTGLTFGDNYVVNIHGSSSTTPAQLPQTVAAWRVSISGSTTYYAKYRAIYSAGGPPQYYCRLSARRVR